MASRTLRKRIASVIAGALLFAQLAVAAHACPLLQGASAPDAVAASHASMPGCADPMGTLDPASPNLCAEHCKQGQQSDRASFGVAVPPALLSPLYETPLASPLVPAPPPSGAWLSALVAASPPHAIAHCVLRI